MPKKLIDQKALQTGMPHGTFKIGELHPTCDGFAYRQWSRGKEVWTTVEKALKVKSFLKDYNTSDAGRAVKRKYAKTDKYKATHARHRKTERYKTTLAAYHKTDKYKKKVIEANKRKTLEGRTAQYSSARRARQKEATKETTEHDLQTIKTFFDQSARLSRCLQVQFQVDHTVPLTKGGKHHPDNLQVVPATWNNIKNNTHSERWTATL